VLKHNNVTLEFFIDLTKTYIFNKIKYISFILKRNIIIQSFLLKKERTKNKFLYSEYRLF